MNERLAVVLGRNYTSRLTMIRSAGLAGCRVAVIKTGKRKEDWNKKEKIDASSKFVEQYYCAKEPDDEALIDLLIKKFGNEPDKVVLLPTDDYTAAVIDKNINHLRNKFLFPNIQGTQGKVVYFMNKALQKELAEVCGLSVAKMWRAEWKDGSYILPKNIEFPVYIKPETSFVGSKHIMQRCDTIEQLTEVLFTINQNYPILIEQFINIEHEYGVQGVCDGNKVIMPAIVEKTSTYLGVTATGTISNLSDFGNLGEKLEIFIKKIGFQGIFDIDLYSQNGIIYFNELNLRSGANSFAVIHCYVNLPELLINSLLRKEISYEYSPMERKTFASEKVCLQKYGSGEYNYHEYKKIINGADFLFINQEWDIKPYKVLKRFIIKVRIIKYIKKILKIKENLFGLSNCLT